jgi:hypothetical protein
MATFFKKQPLLNIILTSLMLFLFACGTFEIGVDSPTPAETQIAQSAGPTPISTIAPTTQPTPSHTPIPLPPTSTPTPVIPTPKNSPYHTYRNSSYGFTFRYSNTWTIEEAANFITLKQGHLQLRVNYRNVEEDVMLGPGGVSAGDLEARETIPFLDIGVRKTVLVYEGQDKAVFYGAPGTDILRDRLVFTIFLIDSQPDYAQAIISPETHTEVDRIVRSFRWLAAGTSMAAPTSTPPSTENQTDSPVALDTANLPKNIPTDCMEKQSKDVTISPGQADETYIVNGNQVIYPILICTNSFDDRSDYNWAFLLKLNGNIQPDLSMQYWIHPDSTTPSVRGENGAIYPFRYNERRGEYNALGAGDSGIYLLIFEFDSADDIPPVIEFSVNVEYFYV